MSVNVSIVSGRECGTCTACCDGTLTGEAFGKPFYSGAPCSAVRLGKGYGRYDERPVDPCRTFECAWKQHESYPEWMKPEHCNAIGIVREINGIMYAELVESAYSKTDTATLLHFIQWAHGTFGNVKVSINNGWRYFGSPEFCAAMLSGGARE